MDKHGRRILSSAPPPPPHPTTTTTITTSHVAPCVTFHFGVALRTWPGGSPRVPLSVDGGDDCVPCWGMSSSRSPWLWQLHNARKPTRKKNKPPPGARPRSLRHFAGDTHPTLLAGASGEVVDDSTLAFLTRAVLEEKKAVVVKAAKEKVKEERRELQRRQALRQELVALLDLPEQRRSAQQESRINDVLQLVRDAEAAAASSSSQPGRRKRKKRRKRTTRRTSSRLSTCSGFLFSCSS